MEGDASTIVEFLQANSGALFALVGVLIGGLISYLTNLSLSKRDLKLRLREKILDKRIQAHEQVIQLSKSLRKMVILGRIDGEEELIRSPQILISLDTFQEHCAAFSSLFGNASTWLSIELTRELNLLQDYFVNLDLIIHEANPDVLPAIGNLLRGDFVDFSSDIEKLAYSFFEKDLEKLRVSSLSEWHKYPREETERRLNQTALFRRRQEIDRLIQDRK